MKSLAPQFPKLPPLPLEFSLPQRAPNEPLLKFRLRTLQKVAALALMALAAIPAMLFAACSLTLHKWSHLDINHSIEHNPQSGGSDGKV